MTKVKEFFEEMEWDSDDKDWYHIPDAMRLDEQINDFLELNPNIIVLDIKYWVKEHKNGEDESQALLIYEEIGGQPYELSESEYNDEFGIDRENKKQQVLTEEDLEIYFK